MQSRFASPHEVTNATPDTPFFYRKESKKNAGIAEPTFKKSETVDCTANMPYTTQERRRRSYKVKIMTSSAESEKTQNPDSFSSAITLNPYVKRKESSRINILDTVVPMSKNVSLDYRHSDKLALVKQLVS